MQVPDHSGIMQVPDHSGIMQVPDHSAGSRPLTAFTHFCFVTSLGQSFLDWPGNVSGNS